VEEDNSCQANHYIPEYREIVQGHFQYVIAAEELFITQNFTSGVETK
jgi:hypothetical protein